MRLLTLGALVALVFALAVPAGASRYDGGCNTRACLKRTCVTQKCKARVASKRARKQKLAAVAPYRAWLAKVRACESGGDYSTNTGNGFYGAYQFTPGTWRAAGGYGMPHLAEPLEQDYRAVVWRRMIGNPHTSAGWPICG